MSNDDAYEIELLTRKLYINFLHEHSQFLSNIVHDNERKKENNQVRTE